MIAAEAGPVIALVGAVRVHCKVGTKQEPAALVGAILAAFTPAVPLVDALLPCFFPGDTPKDDVVKAATALVDALLTIVAAVVVRGFVTPPYTKAKDQPTAAGDRRER